MATLNAVPTQAKDVYFVKASPLIGNIIPFNRDRLKFFDEILAEHGDVVGFRVAAMPVVLFNTVEAAQEIFVSKESSFDKGEINRKIFKPTTGNGLFISETSFHRRQRKLMAPSFQPKHIASYAESMVSYGELIQQQWQDGGTISAIAEMNAVTMSIIGKLLFDAEVFNETDTLAAAMFTINGYTSKMLGNPFYPPLHWPTPYNKRAKQAFKIIDKRIFQMIEERRASGIERNDLLSRLLQARDDDGAAMSDQQLLDECKTLFEAGHLTTASAMTWLWYELCNHPAIYQRVQQEVDSVLEGRSPTSADLARLPYCLQVVKETLRLYPPAYLSGRASLVDVEIAGVKIPKGRQAWISIYHLQRKPEYFPDPERFEPERFLPEREKQLPRNAFMPFGAGSRVCIGNNLALMEMQLLLATLAQRVTFELIPGQNLKPDLAKTLTLYPSGAVNLRVTRR